MEFTYVSLMCSCGTNINIWDHLTLQLIKVRLNNQVWLYRWRQISSGGNYSIGYYTAGMQLWDSAFIVFPWYNVRRR